MTTKTALANSFDEDGAKYLPLLDRYLAEIKAIQKDIAVSRKAGRKIIARIDRNLKGIHTNLHRVAAGH